MATRKNEKAAPAAKKSTVVRKHLVVVAPLDAPTVPQEAIIDGNQDVVTDEKLKAALLRAEKSASKSAGKKAVKQTPKPKAQQEKTVAGKPQILDAAKVLEIIKLSDAGKKPHELAKQFGVHPSHVSNIVRGVTWSKVTGRHYIGPTIRVPKNLPVNDSKAEKGGK